MSWKLNKKLLGTESCWQQIQIKEMCMLCCQFKTVIGSWPLNSLVQTVLCLISCTHGAYQNIVDFLQGVTKLKTELRWIFGTVSQLSLSKQGVFLYIMAVKGKRFLLHQISHAVQRLPTWSISQCMDLKQHQWGSHDGFCHMSIPSFCWHRLIQILKYRRKEMA